MSRTTSHRRHGAPNRETAWKGAQLAAGVMGTGLGSSAAVAAPSTGGKGGKRREYLVGFAVSSASPALAAVATNPIEVVKVRQRPLAAAAARAVDLGLVFGLGLGLGLG